VKGRGGSREGGLVRYVCVCVLCACVRGGGCVGAYCFFLIVPTANAQRPHVLFARVCRLRARMPHAERATEGDSAVCVHVTERVEVGRSFRPFFFGARA
jgi:hypothetical protein